jgi:hypothetical protein
LGSRSFTLPIRRGTTYTASRNELMRFVVKRRVHGGLSIPSMTTSSWLRASWPPAIIPGKMP